MRVDRMVLAGIAGIPVPDGLTVDDEFTLNVKVRVFSLERNKIDVTTLGGEKEYLDGELELEGVVESEVAA